MDNYKKAVQDHYREQAVQFQLDSTSTMSDKIVRNMEIEAIKSYLDVLLPRTSGTKLLEIGCGNGYLLNILRRCYPTLKLWGIDFTLEMVNFARSRGLSETIVEHGDITHMTFRTGMFDIVVSERVIINLLNLDDQLKAFAEVARVLKLGGYFICIEAFSSPLKNLNQARSELCLPPIKPPVYNRWFEDEDFLMFLKTGFEVCPPSNFGTEVGKLPEANFLSTHYFVSRVFHDLIKPADGQLRNTHFVKFFSAVLPPFGDYAPVKIFLLHRVGQ